MDPIPAWVRRFWDKWDLRILVLLGLTLQIILSLLGNRRRYVSSLWISILVWSAYLMADWVATVALGKLSDAQVNYDNGNSSRAIWAPILLLHLGSPDSITAYSLDDNHRWMRHFFELVIQIFVAVYVILMSWKHSWLSTMSIPALVAGFIKYWDRTWVLRSACHDKSEDNVPFGDLGGGSNLGSDNTLEDQNFIRVYEKAIEVEMGLMFDLFYTKAPIKFRKEGWILRCISFVCTVTVLIGLTFEIISPREDGEKWHKVDIAITEVLVVGALALEI
ncbi:hypothetical protein Vadar_011902 [Vaccinium darrowii]|uniref:Uncharacterized protein n=1 Tax=Vaccinium darrowii TaxID=229202 RepID=A0ACB7ZK36_9ERIC|nr:hypothetical protein Vadar_011902 [Vaccinium darrowii]